MFVVSAEVLRLRLRRAFSSFAASNIAGNRATEIKVKGKSEVLLVDGSRSRVGSCGSPVLRPCSRLVYTSFVFVSSSPSSRLLHLLVFSLPSSSSVPATRLIIMLEGLDVWTATMLICN